LSLVATHSEKNGFAVKRIQFDGHQLGEQTACYVDRNYTN